MSTHLSMRTADAELSAQRVIKETRHRALFLSALCIVVGIGVLASVVLRTRSLDYQTQLRRHQANIVLLEDSVSRSINEINRLNGEIRVGYAEVQRLASMQASLEGLNRGQVSTIESLKSDILRIGQERSLAIRTKERIIAQLASDTVRLSQSVSESNHAIARLMGDTARLSESYRQLAEANARSLAHVGLLRDDSLRAAARVVDLQSDTAVKAAAISRLSEQQKELAVQLRDSSNQLVDAQTRISSLIQDSSSLSGRISALEASISQLPDSCRASLRQ